MDILHQCLSLVPVPYLAPAFAAFRFIWSSVEQAQASKQQLKVLTQSIAQLLQTLNGQYRAQRLLEVQTSKSFTDLCGFVMFVLLLYWFGHLWEPCRLLEEISTFVEKDASCTFLKLLFTKDQRITKIDEYQRRIATLVTSFQASCPHLWRLHTVTWTDPIDIGVAWHSCLAGEEWQFSLGRSTGTKRVVDSTWNESAVADGNLKYAIAHRCTSTQLTRFAIDAHQRNMMAMIVSLQRRLQTRSDEARERQFYTHALQRLTTASGRHVEIEEWMITSYDVEFGHEIGSGGLYVTSVPAAVTYSLI